MDWVLCYLLRITFYALNQPAWLACQSLAAIKSGENSKTAEPGLKREKNAG
jgi:hypothetical protein